MFFTYAGIAMCTGWVTRLCGSIRAVAERRVCRDARETVRAAALQAEHEFAQRHGLAAKLVRRGDAAESLAQRALDRLAHDGARRVVNVAQGNGVDVRRQHGGAPVRGSILPGRSWVVTTRGGGRTPTAEGSRT